MKNLLYPSLVAFVCLFTACQKDEPVTPNDPDPQIVPKVEDYFPLETGNKWIYDRHEFEDGQEYLKTTDTLTIRGGQAIDGETFVELEASSRTLELFFPKYLRIAGDELLDEEGNVWLTIPGNNEVFHRDTFLKGDPLKAFAVYNKQLATDRQDILVPAGDFSCLEVNTTMISFEPDYPFGNRMSYEFYAEEVGLVKKNLLYYSADVSLEIRLQDFQLE